MEMSPISTNPTVAPPEIKSMPGRPEASTREDVHKGLSHQQGKNYQIQTRERAKLQKAQTEGEHSTKRSRGRPSAAPSASPGPAKRSRGRPPAAPSATKGARGRPSIAPAAPNASAALAKSARGRPPAAASTPPTCPSPANYHVGSSTPAD
ncbi:hypothetical protein KY284_029978 [Solanum tuberosum]|nr:hypothetical protein KY284_029978 [Solanum tuberosum]